MREAGTWPKINSVSGAMILSQVTIQQRHAPRESYVKNVRTIIQLLIQLLFMVISTKSKTMHQEKMMIGKRKKLSCQIDFSSASINQETNMVSMCVVPVTVKHKNSSREVKTFAMLDNCSQGTFDKEGLLKKLKIGGRATSISKL